MIGVSAAILASLRRRAGSVAAARRSRRPRQERLGRMAGRRSVLGSVRGTSRAASPGPARRPGATQAPRRASRARRAPRRTKASAPSDGSSEPPRTWAAKLLATCGVALLLALGSPAHATVANATRTVTHNGSGGSSFPFTFPVLSADHLRVQLKTVATQVTCTMTRITSGTCGSSCGCYSVSLLPASAGGTVTTTAVVASTHQVIITRSVPVTQTTDFSSQENYSAQRTEDAVDKLTMIIQQIQAVAGSDGTTAVETHVGLADPHTQYWLLAGRSGGQTGIGGTGSGDDAWIKSTSHATKGEVKLGSTGTELCLDDVNDRVGIGMCSATTTLDVNGVATVTGIINSGSNYYHSVDTGAAALSGSDNGAIVGAATAGVRAYGSAHATLANRLALHGAETMFFDASSTERASVDSAGLTIGDDLILNLDGDVRRANSTDNFSVSGSTTAPGTSAGINIYGSSHASLANRMDLFADVLDVEDESGTMELFSVSSQGGGFFWTFVPTLLIRPLADCGAACTANSPIDTSTCNSVIYTDDNGAVVNLGATTALNAGCSMTVVNTAADNTADIIIRPAGGDSIFGSCLTAAGYVQFTGVASADVVSAATQHRSDSWTGYTDGTNWYTTDCNGWDN